jgi:hypothetical protein
MTQGNRSRGKFGRMDILICALIIAVAAMISAIHHQREAAENQAQREHFNRLSATLMRELLKNPPDPSILTNPPRGKVAP